MGTRALIHVKESDKNSQTIVTIYRQYDGYPEGLGEEIKAIIGDKALSNGITDGCFNGMGCFAAWLVRELKTRIGNVYIMPPNTENVNEEYVYTIYARDSKRLEIGETGLILIDCESIYEDES